MPGVEPTPPPDGGQPRLSEEEFRRWRQESGEARRAAEAAAAAQRRADLDAGRVPVDDMTGKELHEFHPELFEGY